MLSRLRLTRQHLKYTLPTSSPRTIPGAFTMSTFTISSPTSGEVPVHLTSDLTKDQLLSFPAYKTWMSTLEHSLSLQQKDKNHTFHAAPYKLRKIDIQSVDFFGGGKLGFVKLKADISNEKGEKLPGSVFLRGGSVGMMVGISPDHWQ